MTARAMGLKNAAVALLMANAMAVLLIALTAGQSERPEDPPPIIVLSEAGGFSFETGSAKISPAFAASLSEDIIPLIAQYAMTYRCDVIEVIGHTDGQRVQSRSNLDTELMGAVEDGLAGIIPGSNADLGLMRAWSVARVLQSSPSLDGLSVAAYSAGQMLVLDGSYAQPSDFADIPERRRIEIRVRRSPQKDAQHGGREAVVESIEGAAHEANSTS